MAEGKSHRKPKSGRKADKRKTAEKKKKSDGGGGDNEAARKQNPKAFIFKSRGKAKIQRARTAEKDQKRMHAPAVERPVEEPPPFTILVHGPPGVGKTTLIKCLIKNYTRQDVRQIKGPVTVVAGKARRLTFIECPQDLNAMIDAAKYADLVLLLVDGSFGFEMETFEFLNLLQVHGFPKVMGVLTHLDGFKDVKALKKTKKALKHRFWAEIYQGAKLFYLSGTKNGNYLKREVHNLARFISVMKFRPLTWRQVHPFLVADRFEDVTPGEAVRQDPLCDRDISVYGYVRGTNWKEGITAHMAGVGDFRVEEAAAMPDPCPLPSQLKRRALNERERLIYAPMSDVGGLLFDKDAMYIDIPDWKVQFSQASAGLGGAAAGGGAEGGYDRAEGEAMVRGLQSEREAVDEKMDRSRIQLFAGGTALTGREVADGALLLQNGEEEESDEDEEESGDDDEDDSSDEEGDSDSDGEKEGDGDVRHVVHSADGRVRRRAFFPMGDGAAAAAAGSNGGTAGGVNGEVLRYDDEEEESENEDSDDEDSDDKDGSQDEEGSDSEDEEEEEGGEGLGRAAKWKEAMMERASALFSTRAADLQQYIYGTAATRDGRGANGGSAYGAQYEDEDTEGDDLFRLKRADGSSVAAAGGSGGGGSGSGANKDGSGGAALALDAIDAVDVSRASMPSDILERWCEPEEVEDLRNRFVTGDWEAGEARGAARPQGAGGEDGDNADIDGDKDNEDEVYGDFEDLETGQRFAGSEDPATRAAAAAIKAAQEEEDLAAKKAAKKAAFDSEYDVVGGGKGIKDGEEGAVVVAKRGGAAGGGRGGDEEEEETYYDAMKKDLTERALKTKAAMDAMDPAQRVAMEGHRPGVYVRIRFSGVPCELVNNFDPRTPLLLGGLDRSEEAPGYMQLRLKRHRWFPKVLKNRDPLVFSVGWRRFQSIPVFAIKDNNERHRMLKYSPEHMHCLAAVWGPLAPPGTGVLAVQRVTSDAAHWRIAATGVVLALDASVRIVKKLKLVGNPFKIHRHTAFVNGMFNSQLEAAKFEGAGIRTVSGIRGTIKKALKAGTAGGGRDGAFRATFEDKPLLSDVVFLRAWVSVDVPKFFNPVTNLLAPAPAAQTRAPKPRKRHVKPDSEDEDGGNEGLDADISGFPSSAHDDAAREFVSAAKFSGPRPGFVFTTGRRGLGYYTDLAVLAAAAAAAANGGENGVPKTSKLSGKHGGNGSGSGAGGAEGTAAAGASGWQPMRSVADLRREAGVGAPRNSDSLYRPVERRPRTFNPLHVPQSLQAALPFKTKPKLEGKRKRKTLEQRRAVVVEPEERKKLSLVAQLNAIRNSKAEIRRAQRAKYEVKAAKKVAEEEEWRAKYNKEERKKRYVEQGHAEKRKVKKARM